MTALWVKAHFITDVIEEAERAFEDKGHRMFGSPVSMLCRMVTWMEDCPEYPAPKNLKELKRVLGRIYERFEEVAQTDDELEHDVIIYLDSVYSFPDYIVRPKRAA